MNTADWINIVGAAGSAISAVCAAVAAWQSKIVADKAEKAERARRLISRVNELCKQPRTRVYDPNLSEVYDALALLEAIALDRDKDQIDKSELDQRLGAGIWQRCKEFELANGIDGKVLFKGYPNLAAYYAELTAKLTDEFKLQLQEQIQVNPETESNVKISVEKEQTEGTE